jgi:class 3 adenylate cyclase
LAASYHGAAADAITRFGGHVAKYLGDGVMAFFGYPEAHENDAERAARAGLQLLDSLTRLNEKSSHHPRLAARIGIDSGVVVVGAGAGHDADAFGETPNIATMPTHSVRLRISRRVYKPPPSRIHCWFHPVRTTWLVDSF